jgi:hypothetical protein
MDTITPDLWRAADAALLAEVRAEAAKRPAPEVMQRAMARLRAWTALEKHRHKVFKVTVGDK